MDGTPRSNIAESVEITTTSAPSRALLARMKFVEVHRADFFLAFDDELDVHGQRARLLQVRLDGLEVHEHLALVVRRPAGVDLAVADGRFERRRFPEFEGSHRLHVVVAIEKDRRRARRA